MAHSFGSDNGAEETSDFRSYSEFLCGLAVTFDHSSPYRINHTATGAEETTVWPSLVMR